MKQVIVVRNDLKLGKGKIAAQACHASLESYKKANSDAILSWENSGVKKIVLKVESEKELLEIFEQLKAAKMKPALIKDAGLTEVEPGTITCLGVGPVQEKDVDKITGKLKML